MKRVEDITAEDKEVFKAPLEQATPQSANTIADLRMIDKLCRKIDEAKGSLELEDAEFSFLKERLDYYTNWSPDAKSREMILLAVDKLEKVGKK